MGLFTPAPLPHRNFQNIKAMTMKLRGQIERPKIYFLKYFTYDDFQTSAMLDPPPWISKFFQNVSKMPKITEKVLKNNIRVQKGLKGAKSCIQKLQIWKKTSVKMRLPWQHQVPENSLSYQSFQR